MNPYKAIIFDYGGVIHLVPETNGATIFDVICPALELDQEEFKALYFANNYRNNLQGWDHKETLLYVVKKMTESDQAQKDILQKAEGIIEDFQRKRTLNVELLEAIKKMKKAGYVVALLSNYNSALRRVVAENGVAEIFGSNIFISTEIGSQKPDPAIFNHTFKALGVLPSEAIFIDDSPMSLSTAESIGYQPIQFRDTTQVLSALHYLGITW